MGPAPSSLAFLDPTQPHPAVGLGRSQLGVQEPGWGLGRVLKHLPQASREQVSLQVPS